jgi:nitrite reductase/ring-hydroxylating ferredoxin subunit
VSSAEIDETGEAVSARLGPVEAIPVGEGRAFLVGDEPVAVFRPRSGGLHALRAICPHRGGPLADGLTDGEVVMCPLHNHQFRLASGECVSGGDVADVAAYTATEEDGELVVSLVAPGG